MQKRIMHLDMDAFYASVEALDNSSLAGRPVVVGGKGPRSVVCACSYAARKFGVRSAMPMRRALELCPEAEVLRPRMERYTALSREIFEYLESEVPLVEKVSIDEGYLDLTALARYNGAALALARRLKEGVRKRFGLPCSAGIAPCKFVAKIASDLEKPNALVLVSQKEVLRFLDPLGVERIPGVGPAGLKKLHAVKVKTIRQLRRQSRDALTGMFGKWGGRLHDFARGIDPRPVVTHHERKSLGAERTFDRDVRDAKTIRKVLREQSEKIAARLQSQDLRIRTVTVKIRYGDFTQVTRQESFDHAANTAAEIYAVARDQLARTEAARRPVRLAGLSVSNFTADSAQSELPLFPESGAKEE